MRTTIRHNAPLGMQLCPEDNTSRYVAEQVAFWRQDRHYVIHTQIAMEIAAWWHDGTYHGQLFGKFSQLGQIQRDFVDSIDHEISRYVEELQTGWHAPDPVTWLNSDSENADALNALHALRAYVARHNKEQWGDSE